MEGLDGIGHQLLASPRELSQTVMPEQVCHKVSFTNDVRVGYAKLHRLPARYRHLPPRRANGLDEVAVDAVMFFSYWSGILALRLMQLA